MVVFTCGHCGESVQKPKVEKHYLTKCRNRNPNLSCMDCFKDFLGKDYESHIKCVTEEQRYSGKGFVAKEKKGEKKQNAWVEMLQSVLDEQKTAPKNVLRIIETISKHNNTPRKKPKFFNFVKNVCGSKTSPKDIDQAWDLISGKLSALSSVNNAQNKNEKTSGDETNKDSGDPDTNQDEDSENDAKENSLQSEKNESESEIKIKKNDQELENVEEKKLSKKQRKEEKKRKKYEAELQSAAEPVEEEEEVQPNKKDKKKKNKSEALTNVNETDEDTKSKKKRKRQDTANSTAEVIDNGVEHENEIPIVAKDKSLKKKLKVKVEEDADENISMCLHDLNVANGEETEEPVAKQDKFDWHAVIISVLEKKGNELPFKRLQKKVLSEYTEATGWEVDDRIADKFIKKLKSAPKVKVDKNRVLLEE